MRISVIVPIKLNNSRLPCKTFLRLAGRPLCEYAFDNLIKFKRMNEHLDISITVYCSDESICEFLPDGIDFLQRNNRLDGDEVLMSEVIDNFIEMVKSDIYILTFITAPFLKPESISKALKIMIDNKLDSIHSVQKIKSFCDFKPIYIHTSGFYIFDDKTAKASRRIGENWKYFVISDKESVDIDTPEDLEFARQIV
jgi:CMP-N-acetylneuraminic acid synthetase